MMFGSAPGVSEFENGEGSVDKSRTRQEAGLSGGLKSAFLEGNGGVVEGRGVRSKWGGDGRA